MNFRTVIAFFFISILTCLIVLMSFVLFSMVAMESFVKKYFALFCKLMSIRYKIHGENNINNLRSCIYVSNHSSLLDIPMVRLALPLNTKFIAKKELFSIPIFGLALKRYGQIPIDRANKRKAIASLEFAIQKLKEGFSIWMAPEGTRNRNGLLLPFKKGAFLTAKKAGVPIVPVSLCGTWKLLPKSSLKLGSGRVDIFIHPPVEVKDDIQATMAMCSQLIQRDIDNWNNTYE